MVTLKNQLRSKSRTIGLVDISAWLKTKFHAVEQDVIEEMSRLIKSWKDNHIPTLINVMGGH